MSKKWPADIQGSLVITMSPGTELACGTGSARRLAGGGQRIDVAGRAGVGLGHHAAARVEQAAGQVAGLAHDRAEGDALQRLGLLADDADQVRPEDLEFDAVHLSSSVVGGHDAADLRPPRAVPVRAAARWWSRAPRSIAGPAILWPRRARRDRRPAPGRPSAQSGDRPFAPWARAGRAGRRGAAARSRCPAPGRSAAS